MAKSKKRSPAKRRGGNEVIRFAHPFFTEVPPEARTAVAAVKALRGATRMLDVIRAHLENIPPVSGDSIMLLSDVIGAAGVTAIEHEESIVFQTAGDTGHENGLAQEYVADAMTADFNISRPEKSPAFFLHLGDVNYYDNTDRGYHAQFYVPYKTYPGKIIAIPGNHDGELFRFDGRPTGQSTTLEAFQKNFCQTGASSIITSGTILRHMVSQPGVYWRLNAPFVDIVGLYSNMAENPGFIQSSDIGDAQKKWLNATLAKIKQERSAGPRKALLIAVHHPPISNGSHSSSTEMLADIDDSCNSSGIAPDAVLVAHAHDYQRYTRFVTFDGKRMEVPYLVVGSGGRGLSRSLRRATGQREGDHRYDKSLKGFGYLKVKVSAATLKCEFFKVDDRTGTKRLYDKVSVNLATNKLR